MKQFENVDEVTKNIQESLSSIYSKDDVLRIVEIVQNCSRSTSEQSDPQHTDAQIPDPVDKGIDKESVKKTLKFLRERLMAKLNSIGYDLQQEINGDLCDDIEDVSFRVREGDRISIESLFINTDIEDKAQERVERAIDEVIDSAYDMFVSGRTKLMNEIQEAFPDLFRLDDGENFGSGYGQNSIWVRSTEDGNEIDGMPIFNYYNESPEYYTFGVLTVFHNWLEERGAYVEWNDPGTAFIFID